MADKEYFALSRFYDGIINDSDYDLWLNRLADLTVETVTHKSGVDCACGSGLFTRKLRAKGLSVYGVDISEEMLEKAIQYNNRLKLNIQYLKGDIKSLKCFEKVGFITCINDGINYIPQKDLLKTFKSFYKNLLKGGTLIFDISSEYKLKNILGNNVYGDNSEELSYIWFNELNENEQKVDINICFFEKQGDTYKRYNEEQTQYIHTETQVLSALEEVGFKEVKILNKNGEQKAENEERLLFIAKK